MTWPRSHFQGDLRAKIFNTSPLIRSQLPCSVSHAITVLTRKVHDNTIGILELEVT